jgi:hypothetical protein
MMPDKPKKEEKKDKKEKEEEMPHINWLVPDRSLRPEGFHLEQEFGVKK